MPTALSLVLRGGSTTGLTVSQPCLLSRAWSRVSSQRIRLLTQLGGRKGSADPRQLLTAEAKGAVRKPIKARKAPPHASAPPAPSWFGSRAGADVARLSAAPLDIGSIGSADDDIAARSQRWTADPATVRTKVAAGEPASGAPGWLPLLNVNDDDDDDLLNSPASSYDSTDSQSQLPIPSPPRTPATHSRFAAAITGHPHLAYYQ